MDTTSKTSLPNQRPFAIVVYGYQYGAIFFSPGDVLFWFVVSFAATLWDGSGRLVSSIVDMMKLVRTRRKTWVSETGMWPRRAVRSLQRVERVAPRVSARLYAGKR